MHASTIQKAAILGAGVMGAQIAAHFANAGIETCLFDLKSTGRDARKTVHEAINRLKTLTPSPLAGAVAVKAIRACTFEDDLAQLNTCDVVIEAIVEDVALKQALYKKVAAQISEEAIFCTNTSGLRIETLAKGLPAALKKRFCGCHFFNPPRYLRLVELIAHDGTSEAMLHQLEAFLTHVLGKSVVYAKDVPNFIGNRIVTYGFFVACHYAKEYDIPFEVVDQLTGTKAGRPKSATFRTLDVVGLDTLGHVANTFNTSFSDDAWSALYTLPEWLNGLIQDGHLGQKTGKGIYEKRKDGIYVLDLGTMAYRLADKKAHAEVLTILKEHDVSKRFALLRDSTHPQAMFLWACYRELFHYMACCTQEVAHTVRDVDLAVRLGFVWDRGPYELWQMAGFSQVAAWISEDIQNGDSLGKTPLPEWVHNIEYVYTKKGAYNPTTGQYEPRDELPFYAQQLFPVRVLDEAQNEGETLYENQGVRLWHLGDDVGILSFKSKMNTMGEEVMLGLSEALSVAEKHCCAMVIWQRHGAHFSAGANLLEMAMAVMQEGEGALVPFVSQFQRVVTSMRYARIPVVAGVRGYVFGGGCELMMHCDAVVASLESYIGLIESGVGILPAGAGTKEMALRASKSVDPFRALLKYYENIAMAEVAKSAFHAQEMGYLRDSDTIVFHPDEVLFAAIGKAKQLAINYRPPLPQTFNVQGRSVMATIKTRLINMREGGFISAHDYLIASQIAYVICGGDLPQGETVTEDWMQQLECDAAVLLVGTEKTQQRIQHTLEQGKPLRN